MLAVVVTGPIAWNLARISVLILVAILLSLGLRGVTQRLNQRRSARRYQQRPLQIGAVTLVTAAK